MREIENNIMSQINDLKKYNREPKYIYLDMNTYLKFVDRAVGIGVYKCFAEKEQLFGIELHTVQTNQEHIHVSG